MSYRCVFGWDVLVKILSADAEAVAREAALGRGGRRVPMRRVAVLGTGIMGAGMARSLLRSGLDVIVWNRSRGRAAPLAADGAQVAGTAAGAVAGADAVVTMLWDGGSGAEGMTAALPAAPDGVLWAQTSTGSLHDAGVRLPPLASRYGARYIDAPVLGTRPPPEDGKPLALARAPGPVPQGRGRGPRRGGHGRRLPGVPPLSPPGRAPLVPIRDEASSRARTKSRRSARPTPSWHPSAGARRSGRSGVAISREAPRSRPDLPAGLRFLFTAGDGWPLHMVAGGTGAPGPERAMLKQMRRISEGSRRPGLGARGANVARCCPVPAVAAGLHRRPPGRNPLRRGPCWRPWP